MATIKEIRDNASSIATSNVNIEGFLYGYVEDFNVQRSTLSYPLLMFQKFSTGNSMINYKKEQVKDQRWNVVLFMSHKFLAGEDIEEKQTLMQSHMEEFLEEFLQTNGYSIVGDVATSYYERFGSNNDVGTRYEFLLATQDCFGN